MTHGYYRFPTISNGLVVFVCEDDLWAVPEHGGAASRLTASFGECSTPRLSPDGKHLAFVSRDEGHPEVYIMPASGGKPVRLTFFGSTMCALSQWSADSSEIRFVCNDGAWYERETRGYTVSKHGGKPHSLDLGPMKSLWINGRGGMVIGRNADDPARWKRYRGGTAGDLWIDKDGTGTFKRLLSRAGNPVWPMWLHDRIYYLDDYDGVGNIYSCRPDGSDVQQHTNQSEYYLRFPSSDGRRIVYSAGGEIGLFDSQDGSSRIIDISAPSAVPQTVRRFVQASQELEHFAPQPDGTGVALVSRGQPFTMPHWEEAVVHHGVGSQTRYRLTEWFADGRRFAVVSDAHGREAIEIHSVDTAQGPRVVTEGDVGRITELAVSPTDETVAFANHRHELTLLDVDKKQTRVIDKSLAHRVTDISFSPDGRYVAYCWWQTTDTSIIRIAKVKSGKIHDVTPALRVDRSPVWDPDGKYLYFISTRDFNPVYDALQFDLSFPQAMRPFVVTLRQDVPSPFVPKPRPIHRDHDKQHEDSTKSSKPVAIEIDFDGISGRIIGFPVEEGQYDQIVASKGRALFTRFPVRGIKPVGMSWEETDEVGTLLAYDFEALRVGTLAEEVGEIRLAADHRTLLYRSHSRLRAIDAQAELPEEGDEQKTPLEPGRKSGWIDLDRVSVEVQPSDEWTQMYREAWRLQREHFWVEDMSQVDWDGVFDRYNRVLPRIRTRSELSDLIWEMQGELGTSHAYEFGGDHRVPPQYQRGFLGADLAYDAKSEGYRIERILRGDSWNREIDSALAEPGLNINEGDIIVAVGGKRLSQTSSPDQLLVNAAEREVSLTVRSRKGEDRRVLVRTLADERGLRYRAWVEANRATVHHRTGGRVGYVHIPDMGPWGFSEFHRGYLSEFNRDGLIVDVRYNRGGHVSPLLLEKLARKRVGYDVSRYGPPQPYPPESVAGSMVAITNQNAGSDGDIFSHCFKLYKLGPLIGKRTWGGVIGINPYHRLVDGTITTQPEFSFWFADVGWKVENYGTDPDYDIDIAPHDYRDGNDPQMEKALELMSEKTKDHRNGVPDTSTKPSLALPSFN